MQPSLYRQQLVFLMEPKPRLNSQPLVIRLLSVYYIRLVGGSLMVSSLIEASAPLKKPVAADKAMAASKKLQGHVPRRIQNKRARKRWGTVIFMLTIHALTIFTLQAQFWSWLAFSGFIFLYWVTACLGVTTGYHRLLSHRSFQVPKWLERFFATCGALSCQHGPIDWVGLHRHHHTFSDTEADHHDSNKGFWWSHMGWMFEDVPAMKAVPRLSGDLIKDPYLSLIHI